MKTLSILTFAVVMAFQAFAVASSSGNLDCPFRKGNGLAANRTHDSLMPEGPRVNSQAQQRNTKQSGGVDNNTNFVRPRGH